MGHIVLDNQLTLSQLVLNRPLDSSVRSSAHPDRATITIGLSICKKRRSGIRV